MSPMEISTTVCWPKCNENVICERYVLAQHVVFFCLFGFKFISRPVISCVLSVTFRKFIDNHSYFFLSSTSSLLLKFELWNLSELWIEIGFYACHKWIFVCVCSHSMAISDYYYHYCTENHWLFHNYKTEWMCTSVCVWKTLIFCLVCSLFFGCLVHIINFVSWTMANFSLLLFCFVVHTFVSYRPAFCKFLFRDFVLINRYGTY